MDKSNSVFKIAVLAIFGLLGIAGLIFLASYRDSSETEVRQQVTLWGTYREESFNSFLRSAGDELEDPALINYVGLRPETFEEELVDALASGRGPDMIIADPPVIFDHRDKLILIPYENLNKSFLSKTFVETSEIFELQEGTIALPFALDPLVLYWNQDIFSREGISRPPETWNQVLDLASRLTDTDQNLNILQSTIALGEYNNIPFAKDIISGLLLQAGNPIVEIRGGEPRSTLSGAGGQGESAASAIRFYTDFANPSKITYSWNRSLPSARDMFLSGDLALYIAPASERFVLGERNPNLNFDIAELPQIEGADKEITLSSLQGVAITRQTDAFSSAYQAALDLTSPLYQRLWTDGTGLPPVRRDLLSRTPSGDFGEVLYKSALISKTWIDPDEGRTEDIFRDLVGSVTSGRLSIEDALDRAHDELEAILNTL